MRSKRPWLLHLPISSQARWSCDVFRPLFGSIVDGREDSMDTHRRRPPEGTTNLQLRRPWPIRPR